MRKLLFSFLLVVTVLNVSAQGVIRLSNIHTADTGGHVTLNGKPVGITWQVSFALPDGTLLGNSANILGNGLFSAGSTVIDGLVGEVDLRVAAWDTSHEGLGVGWIGFSDPFNVTLGDMNNPASIPQDFSGVHIVIPEPSSFLLAILGACAVLIFARKPALI